MRVRAIAVGFHEKLREPGTPDDTFEVPDGSKASWYVPADDGEQGKAGGVGRSQGQSKTASKQSKTATESDQTAQDSSTVQSQDASAPDAAKP